MALKGRTCRPWSGRPPGHCREVGAGGGIPEVLREPCAPARSGFSGEVVTWHVDVEARLAEKIRSRLTVMPRCLLTTMPPSVSVSQNARGAATRNVDDHRL